ncbi:MAG: HAMP domain-containing sensor histidine kinase [Vicinamibacterales bacterium]
MQCLDHPTAIPPNPLALNLADVDMTLRLGQRAYRAPDFAAEHRAVETLVAALADCPGTLLQVLTDVVVDLCRADGAGVSLLVADGFEWAAGSGVLTPTRMNTSLIEETLVLPIHDHGKLAGTLWVVSHDPARRFDGEDVRVLGVLTLLASSAWQVWRAGDVAARSEARKDQFIATLGHELRNPLSVLTTAAAVLKACAGQDRAIQQSVEMIGRQSLHVNRLVDDLLDVARIQSGKLELKVQSLDLGVFVKDALEGRRDEVERHQQVMTVRLTHDPIFVHADPVRLAQIVSNLVDNATKYTPDRGHIDIAVSSEGSDAIVTVQDDGAGIPAERLQSIFEPLVQLSESRDKTRGGLGLGLTLVRRLAELHGGRVDVASDGLRRGSRFTVRLPVQALPRLADVARSSLLSAS